MEAQTQKKWGPERLGPRRVEAPRVEAPRVEAPKCGVPKGGAPKGGAQKGGAPKGGAPKGGGPKISRFFFPPPATIFFLLSLSCGPFVEFWWCLKRRGPEMCTFGLSGCRVRAPAAGVFQRGGPAEGSIGNGGFGISGSVQVGNENRNRTKTT